MRPIILILFLLLSAFAGNSCKRKMKTTQDGDSSEFKRPGPVPAPPGSQLIIDEEGVLALLDEEGLNS